MKKFCFENYQLPNGFKFPKSYLSFREREDLPDIDPWWLLMDDKEISIYWADTLREQYPDRILIPFAKRGGSDDLACFDGTDLTGDPKVYYIHAFAEPSWEQRGHADNFLHWLDEARKESEEYKAETDTV